MPSHVSEYGNFFEFHEEDLIYNRIKTYPQVEFFIYSGSVYYNNENQNGSNPNTPNGHINLYELNVNRGLHAVPGDNQLVYPYIIKNSTLMSFKTIDDESFNNDYIFGDILYGEYPMTASISVNRYPDSMTADKKKVLYALYEIRKKDIDFLEELLKDVDLGDTKWHRKEQ